MTCLAGAQESASCLPWQAAASDVPGAIYPDVWGTLSPAAACLKDFRKV